MVIDFLGGTFGYIQVCWLMVVIFGGICDGGGAISAIWID